MTSPSRVLYDDKPTQSSEYPHLHISPVVELEPRERKEEEEVYRLVAGRNREKTGADDEKNWSFLLRIEKAEKIGVELGTWRYLASAVPIRLVSQ